MSPAVAVLLGALVGGVLGVLGSTVTAYFAPRWLERWRSEKDEPRRKLLRRMLEDERFKDGRKLETLCLVTGTKEEQCRRLLIEIGARGVRLRGGVEGWALIENNPLPTTPDEPETLTAPWRTDSDSAESL